MKKLIALALIFGTVVTMACSESEGIGLEGPRKKVPFSNHSNEIIVQWNATAQKTMQGPNYNPLMATRIMAMMHVAMHDALNSIASIYDTYFYKYLDKKADPVAALSSAAYTVLVQSFPEKKQSLDSALAVSLQGVKTSDAIERGLRLGESAGSAIVNLRKDDGAFQDPVGQINNPVQPGLYQPVPPTPFVFAPFWKDLKTFSLESPAQFRVVALPALNSDKYARDFNEVKEKGIKENSTRSAEETSIAKFWYEFSEIGWNRVTATVVADRKLDLLSTARLFALVNLAMADSYIAGWDSKFHYNFWRPYTAIRAASSDGNGGTTENLTWEPLLNTPPVHDYPSTHSVLGNAAATVLNEVVGYDVGFTMTSTSADPVNSTRTLKNFSTAAQENADSRVFAGIHFRFSCDQGMKLGKDIGQWTVREHLKPKSGKKSS